MIRDALYNSQGVRSFLYREWDNNLECCTILMHYPSTADSENDDPTIRQCISICKNNGYGSIKVYNVASQDNYALYQYEPYILVAWGAKLTRRESNRLISYLTERHNILCFSKLKDSRPGLPTRLPLNTVIQEY